MKFLNLIIGILVLLGSCSTKNTKEFEVGDPMVQRAMKAAQDSLEFYVDYFKRYNDQKNYSFYLKSSFQDHEDVEHMWLRPISLNEEGFLSILDNEPEVIKNYKLGDTVQIRFENIEDCIIVTADSLVIGHYLKRELDLENNR